MDGCGILVDSYVWYELTSRAMNQRPSNRRLMLIGAVLALTVTMAPGQRRPTDTVTVYESPT